MEKAEAENTDRARAWAESKSREKVEIARIDYEAREKVEPEAKVTARKKEKAITEKRVAAEAGPETRVRVEANAEVRDRNVGILMEVLKKVEDSSNGLKREVVGAEEKIKEK